MADKLLEQQHAIRDDLCTALRTDLIGPAAPDEALDEPPLDRYVTGILYPLLEDGRFAAAQEQDDVADDDGDRAADPAVAMSNVQYPSSAGVTFATAADVDEIRINVEAARYEEDGDCWQRRAIGPVPLDITVGSAGSDKIPVTSGLELYYRSREVDEGARSVTLVLLNTLEGEAWRKDATSFFQVSFTVSGGDEDSAPFVARPERVDVDDEDLRTNSLLYRDIPEFATGHGCSAMWEQVPKTRTAKKISATFLPSQDVAIMESNPDIGNADLGFRDLSTAQPHDLVAALESFLAGYTVWIGRCEGDAVALDGELAETAAEHLRDCEQARDRIMAGIEILRDDPQALRAFQLANRAMADQMDRRAAGVEDDSSRREPRWRPFQLAFVLLALPSIVDGNHPDRAIAELLWFPTGGGKTEAYLGLFSFTVFHRRLTQGAGGVTAIMRYTLRLLTAQQFERAARVVCACERIRRSEGGLGEDPISIGLFVGTASTPNKLDQAREALVRLRANRPVPTENPCQLQNCPWCDTALDATDYRVRETPRRLQIDCRNSECEFSGGLPIFVVDEDLYRVRPTMVIGTVDKFAALPWRPDVGNLFNLNEPHCPPPDLIIQDELHLISGPLGTMTGLYETAVDLLGSNGHVAPKVVASTATIRRAKAQSLGLFAREMRQFPPPGLDPDDSWFATVAPTSRTGARRYVGLMAAGVSHATLMIRCYAALFHAASLHEKGPAVDPYWTLIGYFNSLRVLGAARMQVQDDVRDRLEIAAKNGDARQLGEPIELTSRVDSAEIPEHLKRIEVELPSLETRDTVLATNMISVGVDVDRLGLMVMMGQPQAAAEYIQATSRVGRKYPGLVVTLLNAARSRDRSHYEGFAGFHRALYRSVEASSVTPYSPRARDRGLHAVLVALARLRIDGMRENDQAVAAPAHLAELKELRDAIVERASAVDGDQVDGTREDLDKIIERWVRVAEEHSDLVYESHHGNQPALLTAAAPDLEPGESYPTMWSLRDVDAESNLFFPARS